MAKATFIDSLSLPAVAAPMFLISGPQLVIECCKNGIVGTFPALNQRTTEGFEEWVVQIKEELARFEQETGKKAAPFGVNPVSYTHLHVYKRQVINREIETVLEQFRIFGSIDNEIEPFVANRPYDFFLIIKR